MRIAVYHNLPSGGAKRALQETVRRLGRNHEIDIYTLSCADQNFCDVRRFAAANYCYDFKPSPLLSSPFGRFNQLARWSDLRRLEQLARRIAREINGRAYDVFLVHPCRYEGCPSVIRFVGSPSVYYCHEPLRVLYEKTPERPYDQAPSRGRRALDAVDPLRRSYFSLLRTQDLENVRSASKVLVNSRYTQEAVSTIYGVRGHVSYPGVDANSFRPGDGPRRRCVFSVGSMTPMKGFDFLVSALATIPSRERPSLVVASNFANSPERDYVVRLAVESGVRLDLLEDISNDDLVRLYGEAGVVAYAPIREPFGLVPLEAMACAAPVVAVREGGIVETVTHQKTGLLAERDPQKFGAAINLLLTDTGMAAGYGRRGRDEVLANWTWESSANSVENHLLASIGRMLLV